MIERPIDDYERALAVLSELADEAHSEAEDAIERRGPWAEATHSDRYQAIGYADALEAAFELVARIRSRRERTIQSDLEEDR